MVSAHQPQLRISHIQVDHSRGKWGYIDRNTSTPDALSRVVRRHTISKSPKQPHRTGYVGTRRVLVRLSLPGSQLLIRLRIQVACQLWRFYERSHACWTKETCNASFPRLMKGGGGCLDPKACARPPVPGRIFRHANAKSKPNIRQSASLGRRRRNKLNIAS